MRIAVAAENGHVSPHFGHCEGFVLLDIMSGKVNARTEITSPEHQPGLLPRFLADQGVTHIIAGGMGPSAADLCGKSGIETIIGAVGPIDEVVRDYLAGTLKLDASACDH